MDYLELRVRFPLKPEQATVLNTVADSFSENEWKELAHNGLIEAVRREENIEVVDTRIVSDDDTGFIVPEILQEVEFMDGTKIKLTYDKNELPYTP